ncbi:MAG: hypothetical protein R8K50_09685 [Mariprofundus sp.]
MSKHDVAENIWKIFEVASQVGKESNALLELLESEILKFGQKENVKSIKALPSHDCSSNDGWVFLNETRSYAVIPKGSRTKTKYLLGIQIVLFDVNGSITSNKAALNVCLTYDSSDESFDADNWFSADKENTWDGYSLQTNGLTVCSLYQGHFSKDGDDIIFSLPLGALAKPSDVESKVMKPIKALLQHLNPNAEEVVSSLKNAEGIMNLNKVDFIKEIQLLD